MARKSIIETIIENGKMGDFISDYQGGMGIPMLAEKYGVGVASLYRNMDKIKQEIAKSKKQSVQTPYEKLYENRKRVVELRKQGLLNVEIAQIMGVSDQDVFGFFEKRVRLTPQQIKEIKGLYDKGKSAEEISQLYGVNAETVKRLCKVVVAKKENTCEVAEDVLADLDSIGQFYQWVHQIIAKAKNVNDEEIKYEKQQQDLLHRIEMEDYTDEEILGLARQIKEIRQKRRECKDTLRLINPIVEFMQEESNAKPLRTLANLAGRVKNEAEKIGERVYFLRRRESEGGENE